MRWRWRQRACLLALVLVGLGWGGVAPAEAATLATSTNLETSGGSAGVGTGGRAEPLPGTGLGMGLGSGLGMGLGGAGVGAGLNSWPGHAYHHHRTLYAQQNLPSVLASIEERLRALDALYSARFSPRLDLGVDTHARRLDNIESRLGRLETLLELRLDKITETISSRQLKEELAKDQLSRSVDASMERLHHRLGYMESRLDVSLTKVQTSLESLSGRVERLDPALSGRNGHGDMNHVDIVGVRNGLDELRKSVLFGHERIINATLAASSAEENAMQRHFEGLSSALGNMRQELNRTLTVQNDGGGNGGGSGGEGGGGASVPQGQLRHERHITGNLLSAVERHASSFGSKFARRQVTNMYNELWRRTQLLEGLSKDAMALSNATRRELQEGLRSVSMQLSRFCSLQADKAKPSSNTKVSFEAIVAEMSHKMGDYFQRVISTQNVLLATCHQTQENDPAFEKYLAHVLERMLDVMTSNKCQNEVEEVHQLLKSHHSTVVRNVGHNTNTILRAANSSSKETRSLANTIHEAHESLMNTTKDIQKSITSLQDEQNNVQLAMEEMTATINDFQDQLSATANKSLSKNIEEETSEHPLTIKLRNFFEDNQKHISKEIHNLTHLIETIVQHTRSPLIPLANEDSTEPLHRQASNVLTSVGENFYDTSEYITQRSFSSRQTSTESPKDFSHSSSIVPQVIAHNHIMPTQSTSHTESLTTSIPQYFDHTLENNTLLQHSINVIPETHEIKKDEPRDYALTTSSSSGQSNATMGKNYKSETSQDIKDTKTLVTIVHNDKPLTIDSNTDYSSKVNISHRQQHKDNQNQRNSNEESIEQFNLHLQTETLGNNYHMNHKKFDSSHNQTKQHTLQQETQNTYRQYQSTEQNTAYLPTELSQSTSIHGHKHSQRNITMNKLPAYNNSKHTDKTTHSQIEVTDENKNYDQHSIYHLLNKLEELSNKLMTYESTEESDYSNNEKLNDSQNYSVEQSQEEMDYTESDSTFSTN